MGKYERQGLHCRKQRFLLKKLREIKKVKIEVEDYSGVLARSI